MESGEESLDALEEVFERIQTVTGEDNLDMLVTRFIQGEYKAISQVLLVLLPGSGTHLHYSLKKIKSVSLNI